MAINNRKWAIVGRGEQSKGKTWCLNLLEIWGDFTDDLFMPMLCRSVTSSSSSGTNDTTSDEEEDEGGNKPVLENLVYDIIIGPLHSYKEPLQRINSTSAYL